jgi:sugar phosphate isomerase/epimerase
VALRAMKSNEQVISGSCNAPRGVSSTKIRRREFLHSSLGLGTLAISRGLFSSAPCRAATQTGSTSANMRFGLVTYTWGDDWNVPTLISNCEKAKALGVELRTGHAHGVEPEISSAQRAEVKRQFADSKVTLIGLGTNEHFDFPDSQNLRKAIERAKAFVQLSHDVGGSGVKVKPNDLPPGVPREKTIEQIGKSLNELGKFAADFGQQIRLEVHGQCAPLPIIAAIMEVADNRNVGVCWNSNPEDIQGEGLDSNFRLVEDRLGATTHVRQLDEDRYPYPRLFHLLAGINYSGWLLIEASDRPADRVAALSRQREAFERLVLQAKG